MTDDELANKRHAADAALRRAIELHAEAWHLDDDDVILNQWIVVSTWVDNDDGRVSYMTQTDGQDNTDHVAIGLLQRALWAIQRVVIG